mgnify:CR=1 FL=1
MCFVQPPQIKQPDPMPVRESVITNPNDTAAAQAEMEKKRKGFNSTVATGGALEPAQIKKATLGA